VHALHGRKLPLDTADQWKRATAIYWGTSPPIAAPCLWEDDEVDGGAVETLPHAEEADRVRTHYHFPGTALIH